MRLEDYPWVTYKAIKVAIIAMTKELTIQNAEYVIRANVILPDRLIVSYKGTET